MKKKALKFTLQMILLIAALCFLGGTAYGQVIYVDASASGTNNGTSWNDAYTELADALRWAREQHDSGSPGWSEAEPLQIWVAEGEYRPLYHAADGQYTTNGGRDNSFVMVKNVQLYGGFAGTEMNLGERDWQANETILSGDLGDFSTVPELTAEFNEAGTEISGTAAQGATVEVDVDGDGNPEFTAVTDPMTGEYSIGVNPPLTSGEEVTVTAVDGAGNDLGSISITAPGIPILAVDDMAGAWVIFENAAENVPDTQLFSFEASTDDLLDPTAEGAGSGTFTVPDGDESDVTVTVVAPSLVSVLPDYTITLVDVASGNVVGGPISETANNDVFGTGVQVTFDDLAAGNYRLDVSTSALSPSGLLDYTSNVSIAQELTHLDQFEVSSVTPASGNLFDNDVTDGASLQILNEGGTFVDVVDGSPVTVSGDQGALTVNADGSYTYEPSNTIAYFTDTVTDVFNYQLVGSGGQISQAALTVTVVEAIDTGAAAIAKFNEDSTEISGITIPGATAEEHLVDDDISDNAYHVLISAGEVGSALLDGVTVSGGYIDNIGSITVNGETIERAAGGGIYVENASPAWSHIVVENNTTVDPGVLGFGTGAAGIFVRASSSMWDHITVRNNSTSGFGGGIFESSSSSSSSSTWTNVTVTDNTADLGGGMYNVGSSPELTNVTLAGNTANQDGGGMFNSNSSPVLANTIVWGNNGGSIENVGSSTPYISFSLVEGSGGSESWNTAIGTDGGNNLDADPQFTDPGNDVFSLTAASPALNTGSNQAYEDADGDSGNNSLQNDTDLADEARVYDVANGGVIDMGAYEFQGEPAEITFTKAFDGPAQPGNTVTLEFTIENQFTSPLTNLSFTDDLDATLSGLAATGLPESDVCGAGSLLTGTGNLSFTGGSLGANSFCTFSVTLQVPASASPGDYPNTTSSLTGLMDGNAITVDPAVNTLTVEELSITPDENNIVYVDQNVSGGNETGDSWANAVPELGDALDWAANVWGGYGNLQIWTADGLYLPTGDAGDRFATFQLVNDVKVYGGFEGTEDPGFDLNTRDFEANPTILSGDIDGDDLADVITDPDTEIQGSNSFHVVTGSGTANSALLDGFTITGGNANGGSNNNYGGGMVNDGGSPALINVTFSGNRANNRGGGMFNNNSNPTLTNVTFSGNLATNYGGGGMYNSTSSPTLTNVTFSGNSARNAGGMFNFRSSQTLVNVTFSDNTAIVGGGMLNVRNSPTLTNVTFTGNTASNGGGMLNESSSPTLTNVILWGHQGGSIVNVGGSTLNITYSLVEGQDLTGMGEGNLDGTNPANNPQFTDPESGDYSLTAASPAVNTGSNQAYTDAGGDLANDLDLSGNPRVFDGAPDTDIIDMGAYEFQDEPTPVITLKVDEGWRMLSSPIAGLTYDDMLGGLWTQGVPGSDYEGDSNTFPTVYTWDLTAPGTCLENEFCEEWLPADLTQTEPIPSGSGFLIYVFEDDDFDGTIDPNPDGEAFDKTITLSGPTHAGNVLPTINTNPEGWTLVGNPYARPIDVGEVFSNTGTTGLENVAYVYDANRECVDEECGPDNDNRGGWRTTAGLYGDITGGIIAPGQGFFVQTSEGTAEPALTFSESDQINGGEFYGKEKQLRDFVRLEVQGESLYNSAWIRFSENGSTQRTKGEALELQPLDAGYTILAARKTDGTLMDIAHYPLDAKDLEIPLAVQATQSGQFTIRATDLDLPAGMSLYLYDRQTSQSMPIGEDFEYTFELNVEKATGKSPLERGKALNNSEADCAERGVCPSVPQPIQPSDGSPMKAVATGTDRFLITTTPGVPASELPGEIALGQNYPNPFNPSTVISYQLPAVSQVRLDVYDMLGRRVATLVDEQVAAGTHQVSFNAGDLSSGVYLYRLQAGSAIYTKKLTLIK